MRVRDILCDSFPLAVILASVWVGAAPQAETSGPALETAHLFMGLLEVVFLLMDAGYWCSQDAVGEWHNLFQIRSFVCLFIHLFVY